MDSSKDIKVASSKGDVVTYEEHCKRLDAYLEEIKQEAIELTNTNPLLTDFIRSLQFVHGDLTFDEAGCKYFQILQSNHSSPMNPNTGQTNGSVVLDENGHPALFWTFLFVRDQVRTALIGDIFLPRLVQNREYLQEFIKRLIEVELLWKYQESQYQGDCFELTFKYHDAEFFWIAIPHIVKILIGTYDELKDVLTTHRGDYTRNELMLVDLDMTIFRRKEEDYRELVQNFTPKRVRIWNICGIGTLFDHLFRSYATVIAPILQLSISQTYQLGEVLSSTQDSQDQLIQSLRKLETGSNIPHETLVQQILTFCFSDEFTPFQLSEQVKSLHGERRRDFILNNRNPKEEFWRNLKLMMGVEKILFDAKNYANKLSYDDIANTAEYLINPAFGKFMIIISRHGMADFSRLLDAYLREGKIILVLTDDDLMAMINAKRAGKNPTEIIEEKYYEFLDKK